MVVFISVILVILILRVKYGIFISVYVLVILTRDVRNELLIVL